jgi:hypothetical protein
LQVAAASVGLGAEAERRLQGKLDNLNERPTTDRIYELLRHLHVPLTELEERLPAALRIRNRLLHRGEHDDDAPLITHVIVLRETVTRIVLKLLGYQGQYQSYLGGPNSRTFPPSATAPPASTPS